MFWRVLVSNKVRETSKQVQGTCKNGLHTIWNTLLLYGMERNADTPKNGMRRARSARGRLLTPPARASRAAHPIFCKFLKFVVGIVFHTIQWYRSTRLFKAFPGLQATEDSNNSGLVDVCLVNEKQVSSAPLINKARPARFCEDGGALFTF